MVLGQTKEDERIELSIKRYFLKVLIRFCIEQRGLVEEKNPALDKNEALTMYRSLWVL